MKNINKKKEIVKYSKLFSTESFSPIRSGNISIRSKLNDKEGFFISPSGKKNLELTIKDIVFVSLKGDIEKSIKIALNQPTLFKTKLNTNSQLNLELGDYPVKLFYALKNYFLS